MDKYVKQFKLSQFLLLLVVAIGAKICTNTHRMASRLDTAFEQSLYHTLGTRDRAESWKFIARDTSSSRPRTITRSSDDGGVETPIDLVRRYRAFDHLEVHSSALSPYFTYILKPHGDVVGLYVRDVRRVNMPIDYAHPEHTYDRLWTDTDQIAAAKLSAIAQESDLGALDPQKVYEKLRRFWDTDSVKLPGLDVGLNPLIAMLVIAVILVLEVYTMLLTLMKISDSRTPIKDEVWPLVETISGRSLEIELVRVTYAFLISVLLATPVAIIIWFTCELNNIPNWQGVETSGSTTLLAVSSLFVVFLLYAVARAIKLCLTTGWQAHLKQIKPAGQLVEP